VLGAPTSVVRGAGQAAVLGAVPGFGAAVRLEYVQVPLTFGVGAGLLAMVGTNIGAGQLARAARITWIAAALATSATACIGLLALGCPGIWIASSSANPDVHASAAGYQRIMSVTYPFRGLGLTLSYAFQAAGRPLWPLLATVSWVVIVAGAG
jgi:Na+-driven multidrug efflux pump